MGAGGAPELGVGEEAVVEVEVVGGEPFRCLKPRCKVNVKSVSREWIRKHLNMHAYAEEKQREGLAARKDKDAKKKKAAGPSAYRKIQAKLDMSAAQRKAGKATGGGGDGASKASGGGKKKQRGGN